MLLSAFLLTSQSGASAGETGAERVVWFWPAPLPAGNSADTVRLPGTDTSVGIGGFIRAYALVSDIRLDKDSRLAQQLQVPQIPVASSAAQDGSYRNLHAKESRLWLKSYTPTRFGLLSAYLEYDLNESVSDYASRRRHTYASLGGLLVGQTYSTFTNTAALADIEAAHAVGNIVTRQPLLRWTQDLGDSGYQLMVAMESAESKLVRGNTATITTLEHDTNPDIVLRINRLAGWGNVSVAAMSRRIALHSPDFALSGRERVNAISMAGRINTGTLHNLRFMFSYGDGLARYVTTSTYADAIVSADGRHSLPTVHSGMLAYQYYWNNRLRSTLALSYSRAELPGWAHSGLTRSARTANVNLVWAATQRAALGIEYMHAMRKLQNRTDGDLNRLLLSLRFNF